MLTELTNSELDMVAAAGNGHGHGYGRGGINANFEDFAVAVAAGDYSNNVAVALQDTTLIASKGGKNYVTIAVTQDLTN